MYEANALACFAKPAIEVNSKAEAFQKSSISIRAYFRLRKTFNRLQGLTLPELTNF